MVAARPLQSAEALLQAACCGAERARCFGNSEAGGWCFRVSDFQYFGICLARSRASRPSGCLSGRLPRAIPGAGAQPFSLSLFPYSLFPWKQKDS